MKHKILKRTILPLILLVISILLLMTVKTTAQAREVKELRMEQSVP